MSRIAVALKVKIGLRPNGHADHPDWQKLPLAASEGLSGHIRGGWYYDKTCGHKEHGSDSPCGMQWGMILVSREFADEALRIFPDIVTELADAEAKEFWDQRVYAHMPINRIQTDILVGLKAQRDLLVDLQRDTSEVDAQIDAALDPDSATMGVCRDKFKQWASAKALLGVVIER